MDTLYMRASALLRRMQFASIPPGDSIARQAANRVKTAEEYINLALNDIVDAEEAGVRAGEQRERYAKANAALTAASKAVAAARQSLYRFQ